MPDAYRGESAAAFVQLTEGAATTVDELKAFLQTRLSPIELPRRIEIRADLPRTAVGKLSRKELRAELLRPVDHGSVS
jgi:long-chain acyl-CoA synthetase